MQWAVGVIFLVGFCVGTISSRTLEESQQDAEEKLSDCVAVCNSHKNESNFSHSHSCECTFNGKGPQIRSKRRIKLKLTKRETVQDLVKKIKQMKADGLRASAVSIRPRQFEHFKKPVNKHNVLHKKAESSIGRNALHKNFENRLKELRARVSNRQLLKSRANIEPEEKSNLLNQFKIIQEELLEKLKKATSASARQSNNNANNMGSVNFLQNRINLPSPKLGSGIKSLRMEQRSKTDSSDLASPEPKSTTESPKNSSINAVKSTTTNLPATITNNNNNADDDKNVDTKNESAKKSDTLPMAIERLKEKQKETVLKIRDKISQSKSKSSN
ncbi:hypothetical protein YQE_00623 [Dendroctonus ponderosae]|uniref:Uncharacterized protein n=1 Tax=Dendroctonus ponderosae TaxID=77166 RepID=N6TY67_DENPD|nr:hypothetical protein YQE_00623 [Dendroctonus ponderosae]